MQRIVRISLLLAILAVSFSACHSSKAARSERPLSKRALKKKYAAIMQVKPAKIKNKQLYYFIDDWYGVTYRLGGNDKTGIDCSGFTKLLYQHVYETQTKRTVATLHETTRNFKRKRRLREGDLVYFREKDDPSHVGVYLKNGYFVHSSKGKGVHISSLNDNYWNKIYKGGGKIKKKS